MTSAFDTAFQRRLRERLALELKSNETVLLNGTIKNYEDYKRLTGIRIGLTRAAEIASEVERELISPEERKGRTAA